MVHRISCVRHDLSSHESVRTLPCLYPIEDTMKKSNVTTSVEPFAPIAIIGQGCVLPGAHSPEQLWDLVTHGRDMLGLPPEHYWGVPRDRVATSPDRPSGDHTWSAKGGYVRDFEAMFDPSSFHVDELLVRQLDPLFQWTLEAARQAWHDAGYAQSQPAGRTGVILGNLSYPTRALSDFALEVWQSGAATKTHAYNRYMSGLPAQVVANALGAKGEAFCLDAACASSLYAIKLASDRLHDGRADVMLVGGVNHADDLFLHIGFCALKAMSRTGQSRPFNQGADGLVPAEGSGFVVLKRLDDAVRDGDRIQGVIRGVGLSNDGRGRGMLTPSQDGQWRAMMQAYEMSGLSPDDISLIECHATGTPLGDATELRSMATIFEGKQGVPIGSLKSNLGHLITASGVAGLLKVLSAMKHKQRPPTIHVDEPVEWLSETPFRLLEKVESWECDGLRRAAINNFGFGGNNAHLLVEEWVEQPFHAPAARAQVRDEIAIVAVSAMVAHHEDAEALTRALLLEGAQPGVQITAMGDIDFDITKLRFPPNDLVHTLPQQLLTLKTAMQLSDIIDDLPIDSTGIYMGMQCDTEIARYGARWRMANIDDSDDAIEPERAQVIQSLVAAGVLGTMPNIVANRMNSQFNLLGPSYTVSAEEASGLAAMKLAMRALRHGELDAALVGAADLCHDPVHEAAARAVLPEAHHKGGDVGVILVLKRKQDALAAGDTILATLNPDTQDHSQLVQQRFGDGEHAIDLAARFGHAHAASGLLHLLAATLCCHHNVILPDVHSPAVPNLAHDHRVEVRTTPLLGEPMTMTLSRHAQDVPTTLTTSKRLFLFAGDTVDQLKAALKAGHTAAPHKGACRVAILCEARMFDAHVTHAIEALDGLSPEQDEQPVIKLGNSIWFGRGTQQGETAYVFTGPAGVYPGMGRELLCAMPHLVDALRPQFGNLKEAVGWIYEPGATADRVPEDKLWGSSFLCQVHAQLTRHTLKIPAQAAIGFCSGETNALFAMGAWTGLDSMHADIRSRGVFDAALGNEFNVLRESWKLAEGEDPDWQSWRVLAQVDAIREAIGDEQHVHLTIISAPGDCVIAGERTACERVVAKIGAPRCRELGYNIVMHCPEATPFTESWHALHHRPTQDVPGVRFYTNASCTSYQATADRVADALTAQAMQTVDFPALVEKAWQDGVRVFIEHGPQSGCSKWISKTLGDRPHVAVSLDTYAHGDLDHISASLAALFVAGVECEWAMWPATRSMDAAHKPKREVIKSFPAHLPAVYIAAAHDLLDPRTPVIDSLSVSTPQVTSMPQAPSSSPGDASVLAAAPELPGVLDDPSTQASWQLHEPSSYQLIAPHFAVMTREQNVKKDTPQATTPAPVQRQTQTSAAQEPVLADTLRTQTQGAPPEGADPASILARHFDQLSALHQDFLTRQTRLQQKFIESRQRILAQITQAQHGGPTEPMVLPHARPHSLEVAHAPALSQVHTTRHDDVALTKPLFSTASALSGAHAPGTLPTSSMSKPPVAARATASTTAPKTSKVEPPKVSKINGISARTSTPAPSDKPQILPAIPATTKKKAAPKGAGANLKRHVITPSHEKPQAFGPTFNAEQVAVHASGKISEVFGPEFSMQDDWRVQVRMPEPPLLLCHRVTGIDCPKGIVSTGTLWCESDIPEDAWYLHEGRMPVGIMIESGQADLMLISWMGADFENKGERVYRLLGCELMFHGGLAQPGDVLKYDIHIDAHARQDAIRLFFFHYDLEINNKVRLSVRNGQAGFFSYEELAESNGILWTPADEDAEAIAATPFDAHPCITPKRSFTKADVQLFSEGGGYTVFGKGFEKIAAHTCTPRIQSDKMRFMDEVLEFDPTGGPWGRGYLKAVQRLENNNWFFDGHFLNDPCMPGTLMFEGCVQVMAFYMAACGWTTQRDGWVFEPVPLEAYPLRCRGQVTPGAEEVIYEVLVREVHDGDVPKLYADLMCTVDGLKAFHCGRMGLQLTPAWPMDRQPDLLANHTEPKPVATSLDGHAFGYDSLLACAWGKPTRAFGEMYAPFDSHRTVARLPGPPYLFISRVTEVDPTAQNAMRSNVEITVEYDVPEDVWYFSENGAAVMPYAVLLEAALQPCGWLASYVGCALTRDDIDLAFRNLDGTTTQFVEVTPETGTLRTTTKLTNIARAAGNIIVSFIVEMRSVETDELVLTMDTVFGFFPPESLSNQVGMPIKEEHRAMIDAPHALHCDLTLRPARFCDGSARLAEPMLLMLDRITAADHEGGSQGLGFWRGEKDVDPNEWFFKAHFFQDPVQPGSLGLEALLQLLQFGMLDKNLDEGFENPRFEAIAIDEAISWKYRGQVLTHNTQISSTLELQRIERDERGVLAIGEGSLWVDGMRIYHSKNVGMRIVEASFVTTETEDYVLEQLSEAVSGDEEVTPKKPEGVSDIIEHTFVLDPQNEDSWLLDHCPTHTAPALPMMSIVDLLVQQARAIHVDQVVRGLKDVSLKRWVIFPNGEPRKLRTRYFSETEEVALELWWDAPRAELSRYDEVARARVEFGAEWPSLTPEAFAPLRQALGVENPYESGELFHGEAFQLLRKLKRNAHGASSVIKLARNGVPDGAVQPGALDAALQSVPHDHIEMWWPQHDGDTIGYPHGVEFMHFYGPTPTTGDLRCEVRFVSGEDRKVTLEMQVYAPGGELWMMTRYQEILFPKGRLGRLNGKDRRAFIRDRQPIEGAHLSLMGEHETALGVRDVLESNWFKGTLETLYGVQGSPKELAHQIAAKEHIASKLGVHPGSLDVNAERERAFFAGASLLSVAYESEFEEATQTWHIRTPKEMAQGSDMLAIDLPLISSWWRDQLGVPEGWLGDDLYRGMVERYVELISFEDIKAMQHIKGRSVFFLGNHEVQIESLLITILGSVLADSTVITMANAKHEQGWVGQLIRDLFDYPGCKDPQNIVYFDQQDKASMFSLIDHFKQQVNERGASVMVHAPGTRARSAGERVERVSSALIDMALELGLVIVPVNFSGGLPNEQVSEDKLEFPIGQTGQHYRFGKPLLPEVLQALPYADRRRAVLDGINRISPQEPSANDPVDMFEQEITGLREELSLDEVNATLLHVLMRQQKPGHDVHELLTKWEQPGEIVARDAPHKAWLIHMMQRFFKSEV